MLGGRAWADTHSLKTSSMQISFKVSGFCTTAVVPRYLRRLLWKGVEYFHEFFERNKRESECDCSVGSKAIFHRKPDSYCLPSKLEITDNGQAWDKAIIEMNPKSMAAKRN